MDLRYTTLMATLIGTALLMVGCESFQLRPRANQFMHAPGSVLLTEADTRSVVSLTRLDEHGRTRNVHCAEPPPDVAKAVESAFGAAGSGSASGLGGVTPSVAVQIASARAEAIAQLGERLATVQLLRDALYRACEAYANGALSNLEYSALLSRYDDTMTTLLAAEIAGGAFGRSLAGAGGETSSQSSSSANTKSALQVANSLSTQLSQSLSRSSELQRELSAAIDTENQISSELAEAQADGNAEKQAALSRERSDASRRVRRLERSIETNMQSSSDLQRELEIALNASGSATASGTAIAGGGIEPGKQNVEIARVIEDIQKNLVENVNADAISAACVSALNVTDPSELTMLGRACGGKDGLLAVASENTIRVFNEVNKLRMKELEVSRMKSTAGAQRPAARNMSTSEMISSQVVRYVQNALVRVSGATLKVDGKFGPKTKSAIADYQQKNKLKASGQIDEKLLEMLGATSARSKAIAPSAKTS